MARANILPVQCERCGQITEVQRASRFSEEDYLELLQEYFELEWRLKILQEKLKIARGEYWQEVKTRMGLEIERYEQILAAQEALHEKAGATA